MGTVPGFHLIAAGLFFAGTGHLPSGLIDAVFTVDYMNFLDEEIRDCYSKVPVLSGLPALDYGY
jgi:hypothetical protein